MTHRVLWVTATHPPSGGGMATSSDRIVRALMDDGVIVDVVHLTTRTVPWSTSRGGRGGLFTAPLGDDPEEAMRRAWAVLDADPTTAEVTHVIAFGGTLPLVAAPVWAAWLGRPLVTFLRGADLETGVFSVRRRAALDDAVRRSRRVCVVAGDAAPRLRALHSGVDIEHVPNGIDLDSWRATAADRARAAAWRQVTVPAGRRVLGLVGQLKRKKGVADLLDAMVTTGTAETFHVALLGELEFPVASWLDEHAGPAGLSWSVEPFMDRWDLLARYPAFDVAGLPSIHDGMPNVALEAAALGVPLLASNAGGLADLVEDGISGVTFPAGDTRALAAAVAQLATLADDDLARLGRGAAKAACAFDHRREAARYRAVLDATGAGR